MFSECLCALNALSPLVHEPLTGTQSLQAALETPGKSGTELHLRMWEGSGEEERWGLPSGDFLYARPWAERLILNCISFVRSTVFNNFLKIVFIYF